ncbi:unnamed protein product [Durusdinium trenchii]|uniref:Uncharacterized protein n=1 Tax=Durusdinium trenchii TaxID=1381693 RepID=A0ABP0Q8G6_9DINO
MAASPRRPRLSLLGLSAIIYYSVSGGPYGAEDAVSSAGPLLSLAGFLVMPLVWSLPEALITAELATTFPSNAGFVEWVTAAFGPFWGFQEGFLSWISSVADAALYPVLFRQYLVQLWPNMSGGISGQIFVAAVTLLMGGLNFAGLSIVGWVAFLLAGFVLSPFVYMVVVGVPQISMTRLLVSPPVSEVAWSDFLNCLFWNLNYWDTASTLAGEVQDVSTTYPKALGVAMVAVVLSYFLPLLVGLGISGATSDWRNWQDGEFALMGRRLGGSILESWVITGAAVSCLGQQLSEMAEAAFQLQGMAEDGWLPTCFAHRSRFDTPSLPLAVITVLVLVLSVFSSFNAIINMLNSVYCVAQVIEFSAFLHLRRKHDDLERPFRVPCRSLAACCLLLLMPFAFCLVLLVMPFVRGDWFQVASLLGSILLGLLLYHLLELSRRRGWLTFYRCPPGGLEDILAQRPNESLWDDANDTQALPLSWRAELSQSLGRL